MFFGVRQRLHVWVLNAWYTNHLWIKLLIPLSFVFSCIAQWRKFLLLKKERWEPPVPIIVVGNISIGGTGKTPVVASLVNNMLARGYKPGVVSRGFGITSNHYPILVTSTSNPRDVGDEPVMLAQQLNIPVAVDPDRVSAARFLCDQFQCTLIIADDGLQHYNLKRHVELLVIDGQRMLGNGLCLPAGPLREPAKRLQTVDLVLINGEPVSDLDVNYSCFDLSPQSLRPLLPCTSNTLATCPRGFKVHGVAGIGNPERFFNTLTKLGFDVIAHSFPDHHQFRADDIHFNDGLPVIMTSKDAVKCTAFATPKHWYLPITTTISDSVMDYIACLIKNSNVVKNGKKIV